MKTMKLIAFIMLATLVAGVCRAEARATTAGPANPSPQPQSDGGKVYKHAASGLQFEAPSSWKAEPDGEMITLTSPDESLTIILWVTEAGTMKESAAALDAELGKVIKDVEPAGQPKKGVLNGLTLYSVDGTGKVDGQAIEWSTLLIEARKPVVVLSFGAPGAYKKHQNDIAAFGKSIRKMN